jgi:excisionase family DNA binding protein
MLPTSSKIDLHSRSTAAAVFRVFENIAAAWHLTTTERAKLLGISRSTLYRWRRGHIPGLEDPTIFRFSYVFGIYKALRLLFPTDERSVEWIRAPNSAPGFNGRSALDCMLQGPTEELRAVRQYLDSHLG